MMQRSSNSLQLATKPMTPVKVVATTTDRHAQAPAVPTMTTTSAESVASNANAGSVDFIGPSNAVKHLFSLPFDNDRNVSVALHNMGNGTLLLDSGEDFGGGGGGGGVHAAGFVQDDDDAAPPPPGFNPRSSGRRRRQRPLSWSAAKSTERAEVDEEDEEDEELDRSQLAQLREGERSLLASLSLLLEEEKREQQQQQQRRRPRHHPKIRHDSGIVSEEGSSSDGDVATPASPTGGEGGDGDRNETALVIPSNAIVVANRQTVEPVLGAPGATSTSTSTAAARAVNSAGAGRSDEQRDPLAGELPPPGHYLRRHVAPPPEPRQYVDWKFGDVRMTIASDAVIYDGRGVGGEGGATTAGGGASAGDNKGRGESESIVLRVADAADLRSQMKYHEGTVEEGMFVEGGGGYGGESRLALPPSSYADALKSSSPGDGDEEGEGRDISTEDDENFKVEGMGDVKLQTSIIPTAGGAALGPEWAQLGYAISPFPPPPASSVAADDSGNATVSGGGGTASSPRGGQRANVTEPPPSSPVCTVLDAYLDNLMANVPQLALILREHGFVQNIKLLRTEDIPSLMMHPSTLGVDGPAQDSAAGDPGGGGGGGHPPRPPVFDPDIVEMNAAMLLRFLKANCTRENSTYLLRRAAGTADIQLFDVTSISERRVQRKWVWWLALCSYRFACRLEQLLQVNAVPEGADGATRREYRDRQRSLLRNTLNLLEELADMDDDDEGVNGGRTGRHETIGAAVCEHLADTYLWNNDDGGEPETDGDFVGVARRDSNESNNKTPAPAASSSQPYRNVTVDCLDKANDHLMNGIKKLTPLLAKAKQKQEQEKKNGGSSSSSSRMEVEAISTQLYGMHHKIVNVCLRLADHHLKNYFSSNLIRSLRTAARTLADATTLLVEDLGVFPSSGGGGGRVGTREAADPEHRPDAPYARSVLLQHAWLWEYCGHFARSFAADGLWRDRGHTCGADLVGLFREVNATCVGVRELFGRAKRPSGGTTASAIDASHGQVSLDSLGGLVVLPHDFERIEASVLQKEGCHEAIGAARTILDRKTQIKRDARQVLVAACVCYGHAIDSYVFLAKRHDEEDNVDGANKDEGDAVDGSKKHLLSMTPGCGGGASVVPAPLLRQRLGDACNEIGKILLGESRAVLLPQFSPPRDIGMMMTPNGKRSFGMSHVSAIMLASAQFWFLQGLARFTEGKDLRNLALLRCNLCQCCKIRANTNVILPGSSPLEDPSSKKKKNSESYLQEAVDHLVAAHDAMGQRDADPVTWDMVSEELAATLLVLGVRRRQSTLSSSSPEPLILQAMRLTPGAENAIVEPMERSCSIYESLGTAKASHQAAAAHYQLALYFSKVWTCQRDETRTREKLAAAFEHYGAAHRYFFRHVGGNEATFVVLSLDFSNLYSAVSGEEDCLAKALRCCLDTRAAFSFSAVQASPATMEQMATLSESIEARVSKLLLTLVKIEKGGNNSKTKVAARRKSSLPSDKYKNMYRKVLGYKMTTAECKQSNEKEEGEDPSSSTFPIFSLLETLSKELL